jgi:probable F420-dependent oxidoreductase
VQVGVRIPCYRRWCDGEAVRSIALVAEALGYDALFVQDHLVAPLGEDDEIRVGGQSRWMSGEEGDGPTPTLLRYYGGDDWWLDPFVVWSFLAAVTSRVRLGSDVVVVPYRNPIVQAKMLGTLDVLSGGRMILGTGSGHVEAESRVLGLDHASRARRHDEYLRLIAAFLETEELEFHGEFFDFGPTRTLVRPVQRPRPPIWVGGNSRRAIRRAAELGDGWLPSAVPPDDLRRGVAELERACERAGREHRPDLAVSLPSTFRMAGGPPGGRRPVTGPDEVLDELGRYAEVGVGLVVLAFPMPGLDVYLDQLRAFAGVLPDLAGRSS